MGKVDGDDDPVQVLHEHRIGELEKSDSNQWTKIIEHHDRFRELHITIRLVKSGIVFLGFVAFTVAIWLRGGWEAVSDFLFRR